MQNRSGGATITGTLVAASAAFFSMSLVVHTYGSCTALECTQFTILDYGGTGPDRQWELTTAAHVYAASGGGCLTANGNTRFRDVQSATNCECGSYPGSKPVRCSNTSGWTGVWTKTNTDRFKCDTCPES